jgi:lipoate-protein ligase A
VASFEVAGTRITVGSAASEQRQLRPLLDGVIAEPQLVAWRYSELAIVLGRSQRATAELCERARKDGVEIVLRASGGGAVLAGPWMASVTMLLPASHAWARASLPAGYRMVGEACQRALRELPIETSVATRRQDLSPNGNLQWACFAEASHGELLVAGPRKLVGLCQLRRREVVVFNIGLLLARPDWELLVRVWLGRDEPALVQRLETCTASCEQHADGRVDAAVESFVEALEAELSSVRLAA